MELIWRLAWRWLQGKADFEPEKKKRVGTKALGKAGFESRWERADWLMKHRQTTLIGW